MMLGRIQLSDKLAKELSQVCELDDEQLQATVEHLESLGSSVVKRQELNTSLAKHTTLPAGLIEMLTRHLVGWSTLKRTRQMTTDEIVDGIDTEIEKNWKEDYPALQNWGRFSQYVDRLLSAEAICLVSKALDLSFEYSDLFVSARVLTDLRPVFDDGQEHIIAGIVTQTMRLVTLVDGEEQSIDVAMDDLDLLALRDACQDAIKKGGLLKKHMESSNPLKTFIVGEETQ
mgnify:CR=1 FL=1